MIAGLAAGVALAWFIGTQVAAWLGVTNPVGKVVTYIVLAGAVLFVVVWVARLVSEAFSAAGLGVLDQAGGALLSLVKMVIVVSVLLCGFQWLNNHKQFVARETLDSSALYRPVMGVTSYAFPFVELAREKIDDWAQDEETPAD
jgi:uncharacterized membrane protein required for colicin V production